MKLDNTHLKRVHVNQHNIRHNAKGGDMKPVATVKCGGKTYIGDGVTIHGESQLIYRPEKPLSCGAKVWIETHAFVTVEGCVAPQAVACDAS